MTKRARLAQSVCILYIIRSVNQLLPLRRNLAEHKYAKELAANGSKKLSFPPCTLLFDTRSLLLPCVACD